MTVSVKPNMVNLSKAWTAKAESPPVAERAERLHHAARSYLLNEHVCPTPCRYYDQDAVICNEEPNNCPRRTKQ